MAIKNFAVEQGYEIHAQNGDILVSKLAGAAAPGGDTGPQDAAPIGSTYQQTTGNFYLKTMNAGVAADWVLINDQDSEVDVAAQSLGVTAQTVVDQVLVDEAYATEWEVHIRDSANPANIRVFKVLATHNGTDSADATEADHTVFGKLKLGSNFNYDVDVLFFDTGAAQRMTLSVSSTETSGVDVTVRRNSILPPAA